MTAVVSALIVFGLAALAEWLHGRRIRVAERLAFGPAGARRWTRLVPILRPVSLAAFTWGLATLILLKTGGDDDLADEKDGEATRLVFVADLSPSMYLEDAGPDGSLTRQARMREVAEGILQRVSGNLRFGVIGFYTESLPVVMEARDPELVRNVFNGLPLTYAMPLGKTDLGRAVNETLELVADFPENSTRIILFTDGDSVNLVPIAQRPKSVKEVLVLGIGNPNKGLYIDGHQSRQETGTLRSVAASLGGEYEDVNTKHLATTTLGDLVVPLAPLKSGLNLEQIAILAMVLGALINASLPIAQEFFGSDWKVNPKKRRATKVPVIVEGTTSS
ncbi:MAG: Ca-activated chloride channel family protein [Akkermansiaceae bacterium]|jgi:Ca-activated chloride channel family protein